MSYKFINARYNIVANQNHQVLNEFYRSSQNILNTHKVEIKINNLSDVIEHIVVREHYLQSQFITIFHTTPKHTTISRWVNTLIK